MIGKSQKQFSILDGALNGRSKQSRSDKLLRKLDSFIDWNQLEVVCSGVYKDSNRGRPSVPIIVSLKCLILQYMYNLSDPALEDALIDRLSFQRFLGWSFDQEMPDFTTIWRFRERLIEAHVLDKIFDMVIKALEAKNVILQKGTIVDATLIQAARNQKPKDTPDDAKESPQSDTDARSTVRKNKIYYGYKGHIGVDQGTNIIRKQTFTPADVHDSQETKNLISGDEQALFGDKAYADDNVKRNLRKKRIYNGILDKARRNHPLSKKQRKTNKQKSAVRNEVERPFACFKHHMGFRRVRYVNLARNALHFTFLCIIYNIRRGIALTTPKI
jgi:IS5 family transposase